MKKKNEWSYIQQLAVWKHYQHIQHNNGVALKLGAIFQIHNAVIQYAHWIINQPSQSTPINQKKVMHTKTLLTAENSSTIKIIISFGSVAQLAYSTTSASGPQGQWTESASVSFVGQKA